MNMREDLKAFVDNEVSEQERTRLLKEIENSPELQAEVIELRQMSRVIKEEAWQPQPVGLERTLGALASGSKRAPWWMGKSFQWAFGAGCVVIMASILFPVFAQSKSAAKNTSIAFAAKSEAAWSGGESEVAYGAASSTGGGAMAAEGLVNGPPQLSDVSKGKAREWRDSVATKSPMRGAERNQKGVNLDQDNWQLRNQQASPSASMPSVPPGELPSADAEYKSTQPRYEIKTANLAVEVLDVPKAQQDAEAIAKAVRGRVESSQKSDDEGRLASAELTFRVPVASFETAVNRIRKLGRVLNDSLSGQDVTAEVADTAARLKVMKAEEDQYVELLKATKKIGEVLSVKERLSQVRQEIESLEASNKVLKSQAAESTINLSLTEKPSESKPRQDPEWTEDSWSRAVSSLSSVGRGLGRAGVYLFVFSPIWIPIALLVWWLARRNRR